MKKKIERLKERKEFLEEKQKAVAREIKNLKSKEARERKKLETHYKFLVGAFMINEIKNNIASFDASRFKEFVNNDDKYLSIMEWIRRK